MTRLHSAWLLLLVCFAVLAEPPKPKDLVHNNDAPWKLLDASFLLEEGRKGCHGFFKEFVNAGADIVFASWPPDKDFKGTLRQIFPGEKPEFYAHFHSLPKPASPIEDVWLKDYVVFCEDDTGTQCTLLTSVPKGPLANGAWRKSDNAVRDFKHGLATEKVERDFWFDMNLSEEFLDKNAKERHAFNEFLGKHYGIHVNKAPLRFEGGNFAKIGRYVVMTTEMMNQFHLDLGPNPSPQRLTEQWNEIQQKFTVSLRSVTGREALWLKPLPGESTGHVDMFLHVIGDTALVSEFPANLLEGEKDPDRKKKFQLIKDTLDFNADALRQKGLKVVRVPQPPPFFREFNGKPAVYASYPTYLNAIQARNAKGETTVFIPETDLGPYVGFEAKWKEKVEAGFKSATPAPHIKWIPKACIAPLEEGGGSISCVTAPCPSPIRHSLQKLQPRMLPGQPSHQ